MNTIVAIVLSLLAWFVALIAGAGVTQINANKDKGIDTRGSVFGVALVAVLLQLCALVVIA